MIRHWRKLILLVLLAFIQAACPKYFTHQTNEDARVHTPDDHGAVTGVISDMWRGTSRTVITPPQSGGLDGCEQP